MEPPPHLFDTILSRISGAEAQPPGTAEIIPFRRSAGRRFAIAIGVGALAACLALVVVWRTHTPHGPLARQGRGPDGLRQADTRISGRTSTTESMRRMSAEQLAGVSRMALRAYDACEAGDEQDAKSLFDRLQRMSF